MLFVTLQMPVIQWPAAAPRGSHFMRGVKPNIHDAIWLHTIYKSQSVHYKIAWLYIAYDVSYRIELLSIPYDVTKSYATKLQCV